MIISGVNGMIGEGDLLECFNNDKIIEIASSCFISHFLRTLYKNKAQWQLQLKVYRL